MFFDGNDLIHEMTRDYLNRGDLQQAEEIV
jgi:hypothetical protein